MNQSNDRCLGCMQENESGSVCPVCGWPKSATIGALELPPGSMVNGQYLIGRVVGEGGFGMTYMAWDMAGERKVAVKEYFPRFAAARSSGSASITPLTPQLRADFEYGLQRFSEESRVLTMFRDHPCIVSFLDFQMANGTAYLIMEFLEGKTLAAYLRERGGRMSCDAALNVTMRVLDGLREVHSHGVLHRDVSPDNVFLTHKNGVKLIDFGAARFAMGERSQTMSIILKRGYAPPEQYLRRARQGPATDIYAAAATFYRAVTGEIPPDALERQTEDTLEPLSRFGVQAEPHIETTLIRAMSLEMRERFRSAQEFQQALQDSGPAPAGANKMEHRFALGQPPNVFLVYGIGTLLGALPYLALYWVFLSASSGATPRPTTAGLHVNYGILSARLTAGRIESDLSFQIQPFRGRTGCATVALVDGQGRYVEASPGEMFRLLKDFTSAGDQGSVAVHFEGPAPSAVSAGASGSFNAQAILFANPCAVQNDAPISKFGNTPLE